MSSLKLVDLVHYDMIHVRAYCSVLLIVSKPYHITVMDQFQATRSILIFVTLMRDQK